MVRPESEAESGISGHLIGRLNPSQRAGRFRLRGGRGILLSICFASYAEDGGAERREG